MLKQKTKRCRRGHLKIAKNLADQVNRHTRKDGTVNEFAVKICIPCRRYRERQRAMGNRPKDLRRGRRR